MLTPIEEFISYCIDSKLDSAEIIWTIRTALAKEAVKRSNGNQTTAAKLLKTHRNNIVRWYGMIPKHLRDIPSPKGWPPRKSHCTKDM